MKPSDLLKLNFPPVILIYGPAGSGKTALVTQLTGAYVFDFDSGVRTAATLKDKFFSARQGRDDDFFDIYKDSNPLKPTRYFDALKKLRGIVELCASGKWNHDACILDSLTGLCSAAQLYVQSLGDKSNPYKDPFAKMEIQNWGSLVNEVDRFLLLLQALNVPVIVTAHVDMIEKKKDNKISGETIVTDMFPSSATQRHGNRKLSSHFDEMWYAQAKPAGGNKINYTVTGKPSGIIRARTRSSFDTVTHNDVGMVGLLKMIGYEYGKEKDRNVKNADA